jgi:hypothetical protein
MELPGSGYFYAIAALGMAFVGFTAIVVVLRQGAGKPLSPLHLLFTHLFVELGLMATAFAMLAPTLVICGIHEDMVWRLSNIVMLVVLVPWLYFFARRRKAAAPSENLPLRYWIMGTSNNDDFVVGSTAVAARRSFSLLIWRGCVSAFCGRCPFRALQADCSVMR